MSIVCKEVYHKQIRGSVTGSCVISFCVSRSVSVIVCIYIWCKDVSSKGKEESLSIASLSGLDTKVSRGIFYSNIHT